MKKNVQYGKAQHGFTLIELMLVILIITIMMVASLRTMQEKVAAMRVLRAAQDVQTILSGAQEYYLVRQTQSEDAWPGNGSSGDLAQVDLQNNGYVSPKLKNSSWGTPYEMCPLELAGGIDASAVTCPTAAPSPPINSQLAGFFVYFKVPDAAIAGEVAALLPNGVSFPLESGGYQVQSYVVAGTMAEYQNEATIEALCPGSPGIIPQSVSSGTAQVPSPNCPPDWTAKIYTSPSGFASAPTSGTSYPALSAFFIVPQTVMSGSTLLGWNIYTQALQAGSAVTNPCGPQAMINVFTRCLPPSVAPAS